MKPTVSVPLVCATFAMLDTPAQPLYTRADGPVHTVAVRERRWTVGRRR